MTTKNCSKLNRENSYMKSASISHNVENLEGKINQLLVALSTTQMITKDSKINRENTDMERAISDHVADLEGKINQLLVPLSTTQMITNHFKLNQKNTDMERDSISLHVNDLEGKINQVLVALSTTHMITKHYKLNRENTNYMEMPSTSHPVEDLEGKIKQQLEHLSTTQEIIKKYKLNLENAAVHIDDYLKERTEERMKESTVKIDYYRPLIKAMLENNVKDRKDFISNDPGALKAEIDEFGNTVFHYIVQQSFKSETVKLLKEFLSKVPEDSAATLGKENVNGMTALDIAASAGNTDAVKVFVEKYEGLDLLAALHHAAFWARKETVRYLLPMTDLTEEPDSGASLLKKLIESNLHGIALGVLKHYPELALDHEGNNSWNDIVKMLSEKYLAYKSGRRLRFWERLIYHYIPLKDDQDHAAWPTRVSKDEDLEMQNPESSTNCSKESTWSLFLIFFLLIDNLASKNAVPSIKRIHDDKLMHTQTLEIVRLMISNVNWTYKEASERLKKPVLTAARLGIHEFVDEVLKAYPNSVLFYDEEGCNIFLLAVSYRKEKVFRLIHDQLASIRDHNNYVKEKEGQNILHLAGEFVPSSHVPGAALQMQREMQWFEGIKEFFQPFLQEQRNKSDKTPREVFTEKHKKLMQDGEKWMRDTATSCSVVAALIITIVFAAAFTVPGGINSDGIPNYFNETSFRIFAISLAIALFASTTSVQMFLGMLTSRFAEEDFLVALPMKLIIGLITLFMSSLSMMVAFGAAFCIAISHPWKWVIILICLLGCLPVTLFAWMQFPLLAEIYLKTHLWPRQFKKKPTSSKRYRVLGAGCWVFRYIPLKDDQDHVAWPPIIHSFEDLEMQNPKSSTNCSKESPILSKIASTIVRLMISEVDWTYKEASDRLKKPVLTAARLGIHEFVDEVLKAYPNSVLFYDEEGCNIFLLAVSYRKEKVFRLIHDQLASIRDHNNYDKEKGGRNILHLAGEFVPSSHVPGAALQMQRELQWFKKTGSFASLAAFFAELPSLLVEGLIYRGKAETTLPHFQHGGCCLECGR
ncbi:hypothetical protein EZV62_007078 [Acer yangbiense]|uniref:PGG domain-containing protein n=1 Tax=Acer yangbiense TaxID=1000413 RepID=A0A5C7I8A2_9ROSI|nr:hypothetical protein EZV62_007078 [Acer yangbiense]